VKLTNAAIAATQAPPKGKRVELTDDGSPGLVLRISSTASTWSFVYRIGAKMVRATIGRYPDVSLALARERAAEIRLARGQGRDPRQEKRVTASRAHLTLDALADDFERIYVSKKAPRSISEDKRLLRIARDAWGTRPAASIGRADVARLLDDVAERGGVMSNRLRSALSKLFNWALEREDVITNPVSTVARRAKEKPKERVLSDAEMMLFIETLIDPLVPCELGVALALQLIVATAARPGEVAGMSYDELTLDSPAPVWTIPAVRSKSRRAHVVPLSKWAVSLIERARAAGDRRQAGKRFVFPARYKSNSGLASPALSQALPEIRAVDDLAAFTPHDLRRSAATLARNHGATYDGVLWLLGHTRPGVTGIYDRSNHDAAARHAVDIIGEYVAGLSAKQAAKRRGQQSEAALAAAR
jgi:integrase